MWRMIMQLSILLIQTVARFNHPTCMYILCWCWSFQSVFDPFTVDYRRNWLLSAWAYNNEQQGNMRLIKSMRLTASVCLIELRHWRRGHSTSRHDCYSRWQDQDCDGRVYHGVSFEDITSTRAFGIQYWESSSLGRERMKIVTTDRLSL